MEAIVFSLIVCPRLSYERNDGVFCTRSSGRVRGGRGEGRGGERC